MNYAIENRRPQIDASAWVAPNATLIGSVILAPQASVWFGCILRGDNDEILIGEDSNVQDGAVLHTDAGIKLRVGRGCTIGHLAMVHGCTLGENSLVGLQSVVLNGAVIGRDSIVGAGALVTEGKVFPDGVLLLGSPAKVARPLTPQEIQMNRLTAQHYVQNARRYGRHLQALQRDVPSHG